MFSARFFVRNPFGILKQSRKTIKYLESNSEMQAFISAPSEAASLGIINFTEG